MNKMMRTLLLAIFSVLLTTQSALSQSPQPKLMDTPEGYDLQTPAEIESARRKIVDMFPQAEDTNVDKNDPNKSSVLEKYAHLDPSHEVPNDLMEAALIFFDANLAKISNQNYLTIVDFNPRSDLPRFFLIDMKSGVVEKFYTTHGLNSDHQNFARKFGNKINSGKSSLGFVLVAEEYSGKYKRSVRLDGISKTNSNIRARAIVIHGWDGVKQAPVVQGLSWGCFTLDWALKDAVIDKIKDGSLLYAEVSKLRSGDGKK
jgi:hypothetical protein